MPFPDEKEVDITKNLRLIEWLQAELLGTIAILFKAMLKGSQELILDSLAGIIVTCFVLGKRLGLPFSRLDIKVEDKLASLITEKHQVEIQSGDLSALLKYYRNRNN